MTAEPAGGTSHGPPGAHQWGDYNPFVTAATWTETRIDDTRTLAFVNAQGSTLSYFRGKPARWIINAPDGTRFTSSAEFSSEQVIDAQQ
jgi:hypothetical protein